MGKTPQNIGAETNRRTAVHLLQSTGQAVLMPTLQKAKILPERQANRAGIFRVKTTKKSGTKCPHECFLKYICGNNSNKLNSE